MLDATISLVGNVIENPNLKVTPNGTYLCSFRIVSTARRYDRKENRWVDGPPLFIEVTCWRRLAENVAATLNKGDRALLIGRLRLREFDNAQGERRRRYEIEADAVGPELAWRPARVMRTARGGAGERPAGLSDAPPDTAADTGPVAGGGYDGDAQAGPGPALDETVPWADSDLGGDSFTYTGAAQPDELSGEVPDEVRPDWPDAADTR
ncbi:MULTISPECIES: single-stranded DNA-binding protein [Pseudofrankia]|uniref:single-stranded DNA-binding protein n=1 Tax=Pseudofrankia TaxID=2994363 RepID=UPI000234C85E|nr:MULTISPECIES: single-stranded DNA-binding protein [Pseudofrankia]OHV34398.1 hypothetical protein BCD49_23975 [Pseudofrankia sp. EUN1h]